MPPLHSFVPCRTEKGSSICRLSQSFLLSTKKAKCSGEFCSTRISELTLYQELPTHFTLVTHPEGERIRNTLPQDKFYSTVMETRNNSPVVSSCPCSSEVSSITREVLLASCNTPLTKRLAV